MAVLLKSIVHTHADAKAVFKDPTGNRQTQIKINMMIHCESITMLDSSRALEPQSKLR